MSIVPYLLMGLYSLPSIFFFCLIYFFWKELGFKGTAISVGLFIGTILGLWALNISFGYIQVGVVVIDLGIWLSVIGRDIRIR
ncbi:hypothetical protein ACFL4W_01325 [Planctomycetota bacterium]